MRIPHLATLLAVCFVPVIACEDDPPAPAVAPGVDGGRDAAPAAPTASQITAFCEGTLGVVLGAFERCCTAEDKATSLYSLTFNLASLLEPTCRLTLARSVEAGRVLARSDRADACYAAYRATYGGGDCASFTRTFADPSGTACREAFAGTVAHFGACRGDHECTDGLTCVGYTGVSDGSCQTPRPLGEPCGPAQTDGGTSAPVLAFGTHPACEDGALCDDLTGRCVAGRARTPAMEGAPCDGSDACAPGLYCKAQTCAPLEPTGQACLGGPFGSECAGRCDGATGAQGTCRSFCGSR